MRTSSFLAISLAIGALVSCGGGDDASGSDEQCGQDSDCDDGHFCNGSETCDAASDEADHQGCVASTDPCLDSEVCDESSDSCESESDLCAMDDTGCASQCDLDGDGFLAIDCGGDDCDDDDLNRFPGNTEVCDAGGHDEDCDPNTFGTRDADDDGYVSAECCNSTEQGDNCGDDCDDGAPQVHPALSEICDGIDNDCNGEIDESPNREWYADVDGDNRGDPGAPAVECITGQGYVANANDCDDSDENKWTGANDDQCDGIDNDCDGETDEDSTYQDFYLDNDGDGYGTDTLPAVNSCADSVTGRVAVSVSGAYDCDDTLESVNPEATEVCNGQDEDCQLGADTGCPTDISLGGITQTAQISAGGSGPPDTRSCEAGAVTALTLGIDTDSNEIDVYVAECHSYELVDGALVGGNQVGSGNLGGGSADIWVNDFECPTNTFITGLSARFNTESDVDALAIDCSSIGTEFNSTTLIVTLDSSPAYGALASQMEESVSCGPGEIAVGISGDARAGGTNSLGLVCQEITGVLP